jgi:hypothetical protein
MESGFKVAGECFKNFCKDFPLTGFFYYCPETGAAPIKDDEVISLSASEDGQEIMCFFVCD